MHCYLLMKEEKSLTMGQRPLKRALDTFGMPVAMATVRNRSCFLGDWGPAWLHCSCPLRLRLPDGLFIPSAHTQTCSSENFRLGHYGCLWKCVAHFQLVSAVFFPIVFYSIVSFRTTSLFFWVTVCLRFFLGHLFLPLGASVKWGRGETAALKHGG